jgi:hypothetical protein
MPACGFCERIGWLGPDVWFAHLVKLDAEEIALLGSTGTGIARAEQRSPGQWHRPDPGTGGGRRAGIHRC